MYIYGYVYVAECMGWITMTWFMHLSRWTEDVSFVDLKTFPLAPPSGHNVSLAHKISFGECIHTVQREILLDCDICYSIIFWPNTWLVHNITLNVTEKSNLLSLLMFLIHASLSDLESPSLFLSTTPLKNEIWWADCHDLWWTLMLIREWTLSILESRAMADKF